MRYLTRCFVALVAAVSLFAGTGGQGAQAQTRTITLVDSFDIKDWDPAVIYSAEVRTLLNVYETLTHYNAETGQRRQIFPLMPVEFSI